MVFKVIASWIFGGGIAQITEALERAHARRLNAQTSEQRLAADMAIAELETRLEVTRIDSSNVITRSIRPLFALPFVIFIWKIVVWDNVLGLGTTPNISASMEWIMGVVIGSYFGGRTIEKIVPYVFRRRQ